MTGRQQQPPPQVELWRYQYLPPYSRQLIQNWLDRGLNSIGCNPEESFEPFIYTWFALNAWAACVTQEDQDGIWRRSLARDRNISRTYRNLYHTNQEFRTHVDTFTSFWPIFSGKAIRRDYPEFFNRVQLENRRDLIPDLIKRQIPHAPQYWRIGEMPSWANLIYALAQVRNNLFHGDKSGVDPVDQAIVHAALHALIIFLRETQLLDPNGDWHRY